LKLKSNWGTTVPKNFPPKALKKNLSPYLIDRRHQLLQNWLFLVVHNKTLACDKKLQVFLTAEALPMNIGQDDLYVFDFEIRLFKLVQGLLNWVLYLRTHQR